MMEYPLFKLEDYFAQWEFKSPYLLCCSDAETLTLKELLEMADPESIKLWEELSLGYTETDGFPLLRKEIGTLYTKLSEKNILTFAGAGEGIFASMQALISPGDHVVGFTPCYQSLHTVPRMLKAEVTAIPLNESKGWQADMDQFKKAIRKTTKLIVLNFPHNPTGALIDRKSLDTIIEIARKQGAYIFSDEVYRYLEIDEKDRLPAVADLYEKGISLSVTSKAYGLAGLRVGWLASQDAEFLKRAANMKHYISLCNSAPSEILTLIALRSRERILKRNRVIMLQNLALLDRFFSRYQDLFSWNLPKGGCLAFPKLLANISIDDFVKSLLDEGGVLLLPGSAYDWPGSHFRIGLGRRNMPEALARLERFILKNNFKQ